MKHLQFCVVSAYFFENGHLEADPVLSMSCAVVSTASAIVSTFYGTESTHCVIESTRHVVVVSKWTFGAVSRRVPSARRWMKLTATALEMVVDTSPLTGSSGAAYEALASSRCDHAAWQTLPIATASHQRC
ncbi:hypothetical protein JYU34_020360 [Plutella xylostella]|uniref:Uncharacterized protein n=1 Tax=Plutella xylostella TaxID=51655 RepID=A0ABQ7PUD3_PLUXY|nr:hypothetical protein JYU34_020360 [Plutella xylostella]